jgi:plasmid maintenance system antidote protein VapI
MYISGMETPGDLITATEARQILGVSEKKMAQLMKILRHYTSALDKRKKLVSRAEVEKLREPYVEAA